MILLSGEQKEFYAENGYVVIPNLIGQNDLEIYIRRFVDICNGEVEKSPTMSLMRDLTFVNQGDLSTKQEKVYKITNFQDDNVLWGWCTDPKILAGVKDLIGVNSVSNCVLAMNTMVINKPPDTGSRHPLHQDLYYFPFRPADAICCAWTAMEPVNRENGCLVVVPGSHRGPLLEHGYPDWSEVNTAYHGIKTFDKETIPMVHLPMNPGDTVFFHPLLIHGSGANRTTGYRKAITGHFANDDVCRFVNIRNELLDKEFEEIIQKYMKKKMGVTDVQISYQDFWALRAKEVNGIRSNM